MRAERRRLKTAESAPVSYPVVSSHWLVWPWYAPSTCWPVAAYTLNLSLCSAVSRLYSSDSFISADSAMVGADAERGSADGCFREGAFHGVLTAQLAAR